MLRRHTLVVNRTRSYCAHCGRDADPFEQKHETVPGHPELTGCECRWVFVTSDYVSKWGDLEQAIQLMRPDLEPSFIEVAERRKVIDAETEEAQR